MRNRVFKWYFPDKNDEWPKEGELVHFDDRKKIMHLGRYYKKDQFGRENVFVTTDGAFFESKQVEAWIPVTTKSIVDDVRTALTKKDAEILRWFSLCRVMLEEMDAAGLASEIQEQARKMLNIEPSVQVSDTTEADQGGDSGTQK